MEVERWRIRYTDLLGEIKFIETNSYEEMWFTLAALYDIGFTKVTAEKIS